MPCWPPRGHARAGPPAVLLVAADAWRRDGERLVSEAGRAGMAVVVALERWEAMRRGRVSSSPLLSSPLLSFPGLVGPPSEARLAVAASANVVPVLERALAAALASWAIEVRGDERGGPSRTARGDWIMAAVRDADPLSVSAVCRSLGCGRTWLWRTCARELGCHPAELLEAGDWVLGTASPAPVEMLEGERRFFSCTFRLRWFRVRIHLSTPGAKPILTCWAEGLLRSGGHGVWGEPAPAAGGGGVLAGSIDPTRPRGAGAAAVSGGKRYTDSMAYRLGQMPPLPPGPGGGIPGVDITTTAHHQAALQAHDQNLVFPDGVKAPEEPPEAGFVPGGAAPPDGLPEGALWMGKPVAPPPREEP